MGEIIRRFIEDNGIKKQFVAEKAKIAPQKLSAIINGTRKIEIAEYFNICMAMGADPVELATEAGLYKETA